jgi:HEAT repeat protein
LLTAALALTVGAALCRAEPEPGPERAADEQILKAAHVTPDGPGLLEFFRKRTALATNRGRLADLVRRLGDKSFRVREQASADLINAGPPALAALRQARQAPDAEVRRRAEQCAKTIEKGSGAALAAAAARLLRTDPPAGACGVLLGYLPFAEDETVEEEVLGTLLIQGVRDGKTDPALAEALRERDPARRAAAALVVGRSGDAGQRAAVRRLLDDAQPLVRLRAAQGLLAARDKTAVPALLALLTQDSVELALRAEEVLGQVAADKAPAVALGEDGAQRRKCRDAWEAWWKAEGPTLDLARAEVGMPLDNPNQRARAVARRFLNALLKGDEAAMRRTSDVPFCLAGIQTFKSRAELDTLLRGAGEHNKTRNITFTVSPAVPVDVYAKTAPAREAAFLNGMRRSEVRVVYISSRENQAQSDSGALIVRVRAGQAKVVGLGQGNKPPDKPAR